MNWDDPLLILEALERFRRDGGRLAQEIDQSRNSRELAVERGISARHARRLIAELRRKGQWDGD